MGKTSNAGAGLTPAAHHILLSLLRGELHGYAIMQAVEELSAGSMRLGPGSLYTTLPRLLDEGLVEESEPRADERDERRRYYRLTGSGHAAVKAETRRLERLVRYATRFEASR